MPSARTPDARIALAGIELITDICMYLFFFFTLLSVLVLANYKDSSTPPSPPLRTLVESLRVALALSLSPTVVSSDIASALALLEVIKKSASHPPVGRLLLPPSTENQNGSTGADWISLALALTADPFCQSVVMEWLSTLILNVCLFCPLTLSLYLSTSLLPILSLVPRLCCAIPQWTCNHNVSSSAVWHSV